MPFEERVNFRTVLFFTMVAACVCSAQRNYLTARLRGMLVGFTCKDGDEM
jgi:hypothetical protein